MGCIISSFCVGNLLMNQTYSNFSYKYWEMCINLDVRNDVVSLIQAIDDQEYDEWYLVVINKTFYLENLQPEHKSIQIPWIDPHSTWDICIMNMDVVTYFELVREDHLDFINFGKSAREFVSLITDKNDIYSILSFFTTLEFRLEFDYADPAFNTKQTNTQNISNVIRPMFSALTNNFFTPKNKKWIKR